MTTVKGEDCIRAEESYRATVAIEKNVAVEPATSREFRSQIASKPAPSIHYSVGAPAQCVGPRVRHPAAGYFERTSFRTSRMGLRSFGEKIFGADKYFVFGTRRLAAFFQLVEVFASNAKRVRKSIESGRQFNFYKGASTEQEARETDGEESKGQNANCVNLNARGIAL